MTALTNTPLLFPKPAVHVNEYLRNKAAVHRQHLHSCTGTNNLSCANRTPQPALADETSIA